MPALGSTAPSYNINTSLIDPVTTQQFMEGALEQAFQHDSLLRAMKAAGTITFDGYGEYDTANLHVGIPAVNERGAATAREFAAGNQYVNAVIPWSNIEGTDMIRRLDALLNSGPAAKVNLTKRLLPNLAKGLRVGLTTKLLTQNAGSNAVAGFAAASSNPPPLGGLPTLFGYGATAQNYNPDTRTTSGAWTTASKEVLPDASYYGLSTKPTSLPSTVANPQPECLSPVITAYNALAATWGTSGNADWATNCRQVLNHHITRQTRGDGADETPDLGIMTQSMHTALANTFQAYYRVALEKGTVDPNMRISGMSTTEIPYGPLSLKWSAYLTQQVLYVLNSRKLSLKLFPTKKLMIDPTLGSVMEGDAASMISVQTQFDIREDAHLVAAGIVGRLFAEPRYHGMSYAAA